MKCLGVSVTSLVFLPVLLLNRRMEKRGLCTAEQQGGTWKRLPQTSSLLSSQALSTECKAPSPLLKATLPLQMPSGAALQYLFTR